MVDVVIPDTAPKVTKPDGDVFALDVDDESNFLGNFFDMVVGKQTGGTGPFVGVAIDAAAFPENTNDFIAFADLVAITSGDPVKAYAAIGPDKEAWARNFLATHTNDEITAQLVGARKFMIERFNYNLGLASPANAAGVANPGTPKAWMRHWLHTRVAMKANIDDTITAFET